MTIKFTDDGKKVVVIGKLNNSETIVQEIFVSGDSEIPSGEQFVVKSLHDSPVVSWKEKEIERIDAKLKYAEKTAAAALSRLSDIRARADAMYQGCAQILKNTNGKMFSEVSKMISGEYEYVVSNLKYGVPRIERIENYIVRKDNYSYELRLLSIFGKSDGDFGWKINRWRDDSGSWEEFIPCKNKDDALRVAVSAIEERDYTADTIKFLENNGQPVNDDKRAKHMQQKLEGLQKEINAQNEKLEKLLSEQAQLQAA